MLLGGDKSGDSGDKYRGLSPVNRLFNRLVVTGVVTVKPRRGAGLMGVVTTDPPDPVIFNTIRSDDETAFACGR